MIPKIVHTTWINKDILTSKHPMAQKGIQSLVKLNPGWTVKICDDNEVDLYLKNNLDPSLYKLIKDLHVVQKSDLWRLIKLYNEGGMYIDIDRFVNVQLDKVIEPNVKCVLCTCEDNDFSHDIMITAPGNPIFANAIDLYLERKVQGHNNTYFLGPQTWMHAVTASLGKMINSNPGNTIMKEIRSHIDNIDFIQTYREELPSNSFVYQGKESWDEWEEIKRDFYKENKLQHWTGEW